MLRIEETEKTLKSKELYSFVYQRIKPFIDQYPELLKIKKPASFCNLPKIKTKEEFNQLSREDKYNYLESRFYTFDSMVAGGAIANLIYEYFHKVPAKINDLDFFYYNLRDPIDSENPKKEFKDDLYDNVSEENRFHSILKVEEHGLLNKIRILPDSYFSWNSLIEGFDLNNCQAGIDLLKEEIIYSHHFRDFLINKNIKVVNDNKFPITSFIRGTIKSKEMNTKFYLGEHVRDFVLRNSKLIFKDKQKYFKIVHTRKNIPIKGENDFGNIQIITKKRFSALKENPKMLEPYLNYQGNFIKLSEQVRSQSWFKSFNSFFDKYSNYEPQMYLEMISPESFLISLENSSYRHELLNQNEAIINKFLLLLEINALSIEDSLALLSNPKWVDKFKADCSFNQAYDLTIFFKHHPHFQILNLHLIKHININQLINFYSKIKKFPDYLIGFIETNTFKEDMLLSILELATNSNKNIELFKDKCEKLWKLSLKKDVLCPELKLPFKPIIKHLNLVSQLMKESEIMRHCVSGYTDNVKKGRSLIFHIQAKNEKSTLEIEPFLEIKGKWILKQYKIKQHKGINNQEVGNSSKNIANYLIKYLNKNEVKRKTNIKIKN